MYRLVYKIEIDFIDIVIGLNDFAQLIHIEILGFFMLWIII